MTKIRIAGLDGAKANFGIAILDYELETGELSVVDLHLIQTEKTKSKKVRVSSDNLRRSREIADAIKLHLKDCAFAFGEVPSGGQSADAVHAFGIVVGLYASLPIPMIEVTPGETKLAAVGTRTASKVEMIEWAGEHFPNAPWLTVKRHGEMVLTLKNEHLADAVAVAHAGIRTPEFKQTIAMLSAVNRAA